MRLRKLSKIKWPGRVGVDQMEVNIKYWCGGCGKNADGPIGKKKMGICRECSNNMIKAQDTKMKEAGIKGRILHILPYPVFD